MESTLYNVYYLGHSAWVVETQNHYLIFDCQDENVQSDGMLTDGMIDLKSFDDKEILIFYSHQHHDHYSAKLHKESVKLKSGFTILGDFTSTLNERTSTVHPRDRYTFGSVSVHTAASTDQGVCYLIQADGIIIFFAGDHADWGDGDPANENFYIEIDYIAGLKKKIDLAFIPVCTFSGKRPSDMTKGAIYTISKLSPVITFPMHANGREYLYEEFEKDLRAAGSDATIICAKARGKIEIRE